MEEWVFWLQFVIIVILITFIIVRDKGVKEFLKNILGWAKKKIRIAKIKSKISKLVDDKNKLIPVLGKNYWESKIDNETGSDIILNLNSIKDEKSKLTINLERSELNLKDIIDNRKKEINEKESSLNTYDNNKKPLEIELKKLEKEFESVNKTIKEQKKQCNRILSKIDANKQEKKKIEADPPGYLTNNEKKTKTEELENKNNILNNELLEIKNKIEDLKSENPSAKKRVSVLNSNISTLNLKTNTLKEEILNLKNSSENKIKEQEKTIKQITSDLKLKENNHKKQIKNLGHLLIEKKLDVPQLKDTYLQIENIEKSISQLTKKLVKISKSENVET